VSKDGSTSVDVMPVRIGRTSAGTFVLGAALFALGAAAGWVAATRVSSARASISMMGEAHALAQIAAVQYDNADSDAARAALNAYLGYLESERSRLADPRMSAADKALTLARLALLDEREKETAEADEHWNRAEQEAKKADWKDPSRKRIREVVEQIDSPRQTRKPGS
jgi:hypothetical protein